MYPLTTYCRYRWFYYFCLLTFLLGLYTADLLPFLYICLYYWDFSWWAGPGPRANKMAFQNKACQHQCPRSRTSSPKWLPPLSVSVGWASIASCLSGRLCKGTSDPGSFQIIASALDPKVCVKFCTHPLRVESIIPQPSGSPEGFASLQSQTFWGPIFPVQDPWAGEPDVELETLALWGEPLQL